VADSDGRAAKDDAADGFPVSALSPFRYPVFRNIWSASLVSNLGGQIQAVGAAWTMVSIAASPHMVALVQSSMSLPILLLSLFAGALADNIDRRRILVAAQASMLVVSTTLAVCAWTGAITPWLLLSFTFLIGCAGAFNAPAWQATVGEMVPRVQVASAITLNGAGFNIARSVGPAIGGAVVAAAGAKMAFTLNALSAVGLVTVLARWRPPQEKRTLPPESLGVAIASGVRYVAMSPAIGVVLLRSAVFGLAGSAIMALMPLVPGHLIGGGPLTYGLLLGSFGVGAVGSAIGAARLRKALSTEAIVRCASVGFALATAGLGVSTHLATSMLALVFGGAGWVLALSTFNVAVQMSAPRWVVARALSIYQMATFGGMAGGSWLWGVVATNWSVGTALLSASPLMLAGAALGFWKQLAQAEALNLDPLRQWTAPTTAVPVEARTGPVIITVEYTVREEDATEFLAAMAESRRIRRRDGALNWRLMRDLADPQLWFERYETPTWLDYIRLNNRLTQDDAAIRARVRALHRGDDVLRVRRMIEMQTGEPAREREQTPEIDEALTDPTRGS